MFAALVFERDPITWRDLFYRADRPGELVAWCQNLGAFPALGLLFFVIVWAVGQVRFDKDSVPDWLRLSFALGVIGSAVAYVLYVALVLLWAGKPQAVKPIWPGLTWPGFVLAVAGGLAMLTCSLPFLANMARLRPRRIFAIAKLSFKEAVRRRVLYVFSLVLLVFLFASWFVPYKPEDQVRTYVSLVYYAMTPLLLFTAIALAAFSIPADIRNQTIHTVLTKPVERFEVVLGRLLGYVGLMTLVLFTMTAVSLLYVLRGVDPEAADESLKARDPVYGELSFLNTTSASKGDSVGREWDYRGYITAPGAGQKRQMAVWNFPALSRGVTERPAADRPREDLIRCEFAFDVYRTTKGKENRGVSCNFAFRTWKFVLLSSKVPLLVENYRKDRDEMIKNERAKEKPLSDLEIDNILGEKYGYFEVRSKDVTDYHTQTLDLPRGLFRNSLSDLTKDEVVAMLTRGQTDDEKRKGEEEANKKAAGMFDDPKSPSYIAPDVRKSGNHANAVINVQVECESQTQYVGMARHDLYLRQDDPNSKADMFWFALNFFKGAAGLWFRLVLVLALAVALSTYFSGVISMILTSLLFLGGMAMEFIKSVAEGTNIGGGSFESLYRLAARQPVGAPTDASATANLLIKSDAGSRWLLRRVLDIIPDVDRFDLTSYVAEGFNINFVFGASPLLLQGVLLVMYLYLWALLAYYLMKWREIASAT
jgi:ABC-type transport system involved in multi-copper enzyme maturation permease subunit